MAERSGDGWNSMPEQPRVCAGCGRKLRMTKDVLWFDTLRRESWHTNCKVAALRGKR
jgi:hypothetical protein